MLQLFDYFFEFQLYFFGYAQQFLVLNGLHGSERVHGGHFCFIITQLLNNNIAGQHQAYLGFCL